MFEAIDGTKMVIIGIIGVIFLFLIFRNVRTVPESRAYVIERIGKYYTTWTSGINVLIPFLDKIRKNISLKEQVIDFRPQPVITKDNVTIQIDSVLYFQITDPKLFTYGIESPMKTQQAWNDSYSAVYDDEQQAFSAIQYSPTFTPPTF